MPDIDKKTAERERLDQLRIKQRAQAAEAANAERQRAQVVKQLSVDRLLAHEVLFAHRHPQATPDFHLEIIRNWHDTAIPKIVTEAFRGGGKTTRAEEFIVIRAALREFKNCLIVGANEDRAKERLTAIKHEIENNEDLLDVFGGLKSDVWTEHKIVLANGVCIQARGRGQSIRGVKYLDQRPDLLLIDDLEDDEDVATPDARRKTLRWLYRTLFPALDRNAMIRYIGNRLDARAVIVNVADDPTWFHQRFPIRFRDGNGDWRGSWQQRFPIEWVDETEREYIRQGLRNEFMQEYMCEAGAREEMIFKPDKIRVVPRVRAWEAVWCMFDPGRTAKITSNPTGYAAFSWVGSKLIVWDGWARRLKPNEIIDEIFVADRAFKPVAIGVEEDGLEEFLNQPLRHEQARRGVLIPVRSIRAPRDRSKDSFISGLQPFFNSDEVEFAKEIDAEAKEQLLSFPTGEKDFPNALAFALRLRPIGLMYEEFSRDNVVEAITAVPDKPFYLVMNATGTYVTAALVQHHDGIRVFSDWVREGDPGQVALGVINDAKLEIGDKRLRVMGPAIHFDQYRNVGLRQAVGRVPMEMLRGGEATDGREHIRALLHRQTRGFPAMMVAATARWTLNGFSGGYSREWKDGKITDAAREGPYRTLIEGLESFAALVKTGTSDDEDKSVQYATTPDGRSYISAMPDRTHIERSRRR